MNSSHLPVLQLLWLVLATVNLLIQILYFYRDRSRVLYLGKKITTPLLLFGALAVVIVETGGFPIIPGLVLLTMGVGELGIEGSTVVQRTTGKNTDKSSPSWTVTAAGVLFLLVNLFLGTVLLLRHRDMPGLSVPFLIGIASVAFLDILTVRKFHPPAAVKYQIYAYSAGLAVLASGTAASMIAGPDNLGWAALILTISDSLVLLRMGASWDKSSPKGFRILLFLLLLILLLYYLYITMLIRMTSPLKVTGM